MDEKVREGEREREMIEELYLILTIYDYENKFCVFSNKYLIKTIFLSYENFYYSTKKKCPCD